MYRGEWIAAKPPACRCSYCDRVGTAGSNCEGCGAQVQARPVQRRIAHVDHSGSVPVVDHVFVLDEAATARRLARVEADSDHVAALHASTWIVLLVFFFLILPGLIFL